MESKENGLNLLNTSKTSHMKVISMLSMDIEMDGALNYGRMAQNMRDTGRMIKHLEKED